ncbi:Protein CBG26942 [Caenorhabditis briggsae]|uniref:Protein CBG26942 n=1 Tax=Caenorhabditis briggsae TaxID=6238 RepID=B6IHT5_CAEBR|nr:Protein CBG26942 [Caenorhabditis briggsae]CAR99465.1 Protein CBG26942 [Caenorhabditis briggsae]
MEKPLSWVLIDRTCPEFQLNAWDFVFAIVAFIGVIFTIIQLGQIAQLQKKKENESRLIGMLALCDFMICFVYIMTYFPTSVIFYFRSNVLSDVPFCDIAPCPFLFEIEALKIIQLYVVPGIDAFVCVATLIFALLTIIRVSKVGEGEELVVQKNTNRIKRCIMCILVIYATFIIRTVCYYIFINHQTSDLFQKTPSAQNRSRYILYYAFCRNQIVTEYPPTALGQ